MDFPLAVFLNHFMLGRMLIKAPVEAATGCQNVGNRRKIRWEALSVLVVHLHVGHACLPTHLLRPAPNSWSGLNLHCSGKRTAALWVGFTTKLVKKYFLN